MLITELALRIEEHRHYLGLTQQELAELSQVSVRTIREVEAGRGNIGIQPFIRVLKVLGLSVSIVPLHEKSHR